MNLEISYENFPTSCELSKLNFAAPQSFLLLIFPITLSNDMSALAPLFIVCIC